MVLRPHIDRRLAQHKSLKLEHSFLFHISPRVAGMVIVPVLLTIAAVEFYATPQIWLGPFYLAVIALAAWSLGARIAISLGLLILGVKLATGGLSFYPHGTDLALSNLAVRFSGVLVVVGIISAARSACVREWRLARTDPLTGALNRQAFFELVESGQCSGGWSALIYADLDGLKRLNDGEGHNRGDLGLRNFADAVTKTIRKGDVFARMGGDEFVIFMKLKDEASGSAVARRLHEAINGGMERDSSHLTSSLGILLLPDGSTSIDAELRAADTLMYEAKNSHAGIFLSTATHRDGNISLSPPTSFPEGEQHKSAVRKIDRTRPANARAPSRLAG